MPDLLTRGADGFSSVNRVWRGETVAIIGGGYSLTLEDIQTVRDANIRTIAVNDSYLLAPWADAMFFGDSLWQSEQLRGVARKGLGIDLTAEQVTERFKAFPGAVISIEQMIRHVPDHRLHILRSAGADGLSLEPGRISTGRNSAFMACNVAVLAGAARILLMGVDARAHEPSHWFGHHSRREPAAAYEVYKRAFHAAARDFRIAGVHVINCSLESTISAFDKMPVHEALDIAQSSA